MTRFFTIGANENDNNSAKLLAQKLNEGFVIDDRVPVGRSTIIVLENREMRYKLRNELREVEVACPETPTSVPF